MVKRKRHIPSVMRPSEPIISFWEKNGLAILFAILVLALVLRMVALMDLSRSIYIDYLLWDERIYHEWAKKIADGTFTSKSVYEFSPLFAYVMAGIYKLLSPDVFYIRILNVLFGVCTCWLVYLIGNTLADRRTGLAACLIAALYKPFIFYSIVPLKDTLAVVLFGLTCYLSVISLTQNKLEEKPPFPVKSAGRISAVFHKYRFIIITASLGAAAGLLLNVRPNAVILIPVIPVVLLWHLKKNKTPLKKLVTPLICYLVGLAIAVSPFIIRNFLVAGDFAMTTSQAGFNLYLGNNLDNPDPYYRPVPFASSSPFEQGTQFAIEASRRVGKKLSPGEASSFWTKEVIHSALEHPAASTWKLVQKTLVFFNRFEACDHYDIDFISRFVPFFKLPFFSFWLILPLGMAGLISGGIRNEKGRALLIILLFYGLTLIVFFTTARYRLLMPAILIPFAAMGIIEIFSPLIKKQRRQMVVSGIVITFFLIIGFLPVQATDDRTAYYNTHAIILDSKGFEEEALQYWKISSDMKKLYSAFANKALVAKYFTRGNIREGILYLEKIPDNSFAAASKYEFMGDLMLHQKQVDAAISAYERSLAINSGQMLPRMKLIQIYRTQNPQKAAGEEKMLAYIKSFYDLM